MKKISAKTIAVLYRIQRYCVPFFLILICQFPASKVAPCDKWLRRLTTCAHIACFAAVWVFFLILTHDYEATLVSLLEGPLTVA